MAEDATLRALHDRLQRLEDLEEIRNLYIDYGRHLDACDADAYAALYAENGKLRLGPIMNADGRAQIREAALKTLRPQPDGSRRSVHLLASPHIELNGDTATGECVWTAIAAAEGGPKILVGRHLDELVREAGRWRFASRRGVLDVGAF
jgi:ketosteroid isomerase-like protein